MSALDTKHRLPTADEATLETLALLKMLALSKKDVEEGRTRPASVAFASIRENIGIRRNS